jgi:hypothetical protein
LHLSAFALSYDAFLYPNNFRIADYGLSILKFLYREAKRKEIKGLLQNVLNTYEELEQALNRPDGNLSTVTSCLKITRYKKTWH